MHSTNVGALGSTSLRAKRDMPKGIPMPLSVAVSAAVGMPGGLSVDVLVPPLTTSTGMPVASRRLALAWKRAAPRCTMRRGHWTGLRGSLDAGERADAKGALKVDEILFLPIPP